MTVSTRRSKRAAPRESRPRALRELFGVLTTLLAVGGVGSTNACAGARPEGLDPSMHSSMPDDIRAAYDRFARKCSKCHSLARPLASGITDDDQWAMYVARMRRQPASGITRDDQAIILRFLRYYAAEQRRMKSEKSTSGEMAPSSASSASPSPSPSPPPPAPTEGGAP